MIASAQDVLHILSRMGIGIEASGDRLRYRPVSAMTPDLLEAVKSCKAELLGLLSQSDSHADREWDRFLSVAVPTPDGSGLRDPAEPILRRGVTGEQWGAFVADCGGLGKGARA